MSLSLGTMKDWARFDVWTYLDGFGGLDLIGRFLMGGHVWSQYLAVTKFKFFRLCNVFVSD
jgi:hypothetical protein